MAEQKNRLIGWPAAEGNNRLIAHNGLEPEEMELAAELGYELADIRFIFGRRGAELAMLGIRQKTVKFDKDQLRAAIEELKAYAKEDSRVGQNDVGPVGVADDVTTWFRGLGTTMTGSDKPGMEPPAGEVVVPAAPQPPRRGRPPGSKDRVKRAARGSKLSDESDAAMRAAVAKLRDDPAKLDSGYQTGDDDDDE